MDTNTKLDTTVRRQASISLDHAALHFEGTTHAVDNAPKLDDRAVAGPLDNTAVMRAIVGSMRSLRSARSRASVRSSSAPASRL